MNSDEATTRTTVSKPEAGDSGMLGSRHGLVPSLDPPQARSTRTATELAIIMAAGLIGAAVSVAILLAEQKVLSGWSP
jgi:hypothetical protein